MSNPPRRVTGATSIRTTKCITYPNRTSGRPFTGAKIKSIICKWILTASIEEQLSFRHDVRPCFSCEEGTSATRDSLFAFERMRLAVVSVLDENRHTIAVALAVLLALTLLGRFLAVIPAAALVLLPVAARTAIQQLPGLIQRMQIQRAANDQAYRLVAGGL